MAETQAQPAGAIVWKPALGVLALLVFVLALEILQAGAEAAGTRITNALRVDSPASALGFGWLAAYVLLSGSPVAAMVLTLFDADALTDVETFLALTGSRLGAAFIVLVIGFVYRLRSRMHAASLQMGVLSLLVTYTVYAPAMLLGYALLTAGVMDPVRLDTPAPVVNVIDLVTGPVVGSVVPVLPVWGVFLAGLGLLVAAFHLIDLALPRVSAAGEGPTRWSHPAWAFTFGFAVTLLTLSVSVSLGILVPLSAKGIARRENVIPYIMGANVGTFIDTLLASVVLDAPRAFTIVLVEMVAVAVVSLALILVAYPAYVRAVLRVMDRVLRSRTSLAGFVGAIVALPALLIFL